MLKWLSVLLCFACLASTVASASEEASDTRGAWALTLAAQADDEETVGALAGFTYALADPTWISASAGFTRLDAPPAEKDIDTRILALGLDQQFGRAGAELYADYWGDPGELTRTGVTGSLYYAGQSARVSVSGIYRDYTLTARIPDDQGNLLDEREFGMTGTGYGAAVRLRGDRWFGGARGEWFDYSRDPVILQSRTAFRVLSLSALTLANGFLDYRLSANLGFEWELRSLEVELGSARSAVDDADIRTATLIYVSPLGERTDIELSAGINDADRIDASVFGGIALTWYGQ